MSKHYTKISLEDRGIMSDGDISLLRDARFDFSPIPYLHLCLTGSVALSRVPESEVVLQKYSAILELTNRDRCITLKNFDVSAVWDQVLEKEELTFAIHSYLTYLGLTLEYLCIDGYGIFECLQDTILAKADETGVKYPVIISKGVEDTLFYLTIAKYLLFFCYDTSEGTIAEYLAIRPNSFENTFLDCMTLEEVEVEEARELFIETFDQSILDAVLLKEATGKQQE